MNTTRLRKPTTRETYNAVHNLETFKNCDFFAKILKHSIFPFINIHEGFFQKIAKTQFLKLSKYKF